MQVFFPVHSTIFTAYQEHLVRCQYAPMDSPGFPVTSSERKLPSPQEAGSQARASASDGNSTSAYQNAVLSAASTWLTSSASPPGRRYVLRTFGISGRPISASI